MVLCDTNILIEVYKGNVAIRSVLQKIKQENIVVSDVTCAELLFGARNKSELKIIKTDLNNLINLAIQSDISALAVRLVEKYSLSHKLSLPDALIAATALFYNLELFTLNVKDFIYIKDLKIYPN